MTSKSTTLSSYPSDASGTPDTGFKGAVICVFCGSSDGSSQAHKAAARSLAQALHKHNISLVYGGGTVGLMGEIARTLVELAGPQAVHGIIPEALVRYEQSGRGSGTEKMIDREVYGRMTVVPDMHTRKQMMAQAVMNGGPGSGFVALSGGYGTLEELMEVITWNQLGIHGNGIVIYNIEGYYDGLIQWVKTAVTAGFVSPGNAGILVEALDAEEVISQLKDYKTSEERFKLDWNQR